MRKNKTFFIAKHDGRYFATPKQYMNYIPRAKRRRPGLDFSETPSQIKSAFRQKLRTINKNKILDWYEVSEEIFNNVKSFKNGYRPILRAGVVNFLTYHLENIFYYENITVEFNQQIIRETRKYLDLIEIIYNKDDMKECLKFYTGFDEAKIDIELNILIKASEQIDDNFYLLILEQPELKIKYDNNS